MGQRFTRTPFFMRKQAGGMFAMVDEVKFPGDIVFVQYTNGTDGAGYGRNPDAPVKTLDYAVGLCTANEVSTIILLPGHTETLVAATSAAVDKAGIQIIGVGRGSLIPTFTLGTLAAATIAVTAANVLIKGIKIISAVIDATAGITASADADGLEVDDCWFTDGGAALELVIGVLLAAACDNVYIHDNQFHTVAGGGCASAISFAGASDKSRIINNYIAGDYSVAGIDGATAAGTKMLIVDNVVDNLDAAAGLAIGLNAGTTGALRGNITHGGKDGTSPIAAAGCVVGENYGSNAEGASGLIKPAVDA